MKAHGDRQRQKAQVAFEYMAIVGIALVFLIPIWLYVVQIQQSTSAELSVSYMRNAIDNIVHTSNLVYSQGPPAKVPLNIYIPNGVELVNITNNIIHIRLWTPSGVLDLTGSSVADLSGTLPTSEGLYKIYIEAKDNYVEITT